MLLAGKKALVVGIASERSIAYGIAQALHAGGADMALTYQNEKLEKRAGKFAKHFDSHIMLPCDVGNDEEIKSVFQALDEAWGKLDILIHSVAYAPADQLTGDYIDSVTRDGFLMAHDISSYSFAALAKEARPLMKGREASLITLTYYGAEKAVPNYNVMGVAKASLEANVRYMAQSLGPDGIRVNAISAGPIRTLAASGIAGFRKMLDANEKMTPLRRNVTIEQVGHTAAFLCSEHAGGITGEVIHVDAGFHAISGMQIDSTDDE